MTIESVIARAVADEVGPEKKRRRRYGKGSIVKPKRPGGTWSIRISDGNGGRAQFGRFPTKELAELAMERKKVEMAYARMGLAPDGKPVARGRRHSGTVPLEKQTLAQLAMYRKTLAPRRCLSQAHKNVHVKRARGACESCGFKPHPSLAARVLHIHHVIPVVKGGSDDPKNLVTICANCHAIGHASWRASKKYAWEGPASREQFLRELPIRAAGHYPHPDAEAAAL